MLVPTTREKTLTFIGARCTWNSGQRTGQIAAVSADLQTLLIISGFDNTLVIIPYSDVVMLPRR